MYLYTVNYNFNEEQLCKMEIKYLFDLKIDSKYFLSSKNIDVNRSPFIKTKLKIIADSQSIEELVNIIIKDRISYENFKVKYFIVEGNIDFNLKLKVEDIIGDAIYGNAKIHEPEIFLGVTNMKDRWILGEYEKNNGIWNFHNKKPVYYCNALPTRISRAVVNIAVGDNTNLKIVDPCCGIGTVVIEAISMGLDVKGYDINPKVVYGAKQNLKYFGYPDAVDVADIRDIKDKYDVSIIDIPYGILSITSKNEYKYILESARKISDKLVLISSELLDKELINAGFRLIDRCEISKRDFIRYISVCIWGGF